MFNKNDPLIGSVKQVMAENQVRRDVEKQLNEELGITTKKALPFEHHAEYDSLLEQRIAEALHPNQQKLDVHEPEKDELTKQDFVKLRAMKKKTVKEEGEETREGGAVKYNGKTVVSPTAHKAEPEGPSKSDRDALTAKIKGIMKEAAQLDEKAVSKAQQRFFGLVRGIQKGEAKGSEKAEKAAKEMSTKEVRKYAKTKQKGLPEKVDVKEDADPVTGASNPRYAPRNPATAMGRGTTLGVVEPLTPSDRERPPTAAPRTSFDPEEVSRNSFENRLRRNEVPMSGTQGPITQTKRSFDDEFAAARKEAGGPRGVFKYDGEDYQTNIKGKERYRPPSQLRRVGGYGGLSPMNESNLDIDAVMEEIARNLGEAKMNKIMEARPEKFSGTFNQFKEKNPGATLGQFMNAQRGLTARVGGRNDPEVIAARRAQSTNQAEKDAPVYTPRSGTTMSSQAQTQRNVAAARDDMEQGDAMRNRAAAPATRTTTGASRAPTTPPAVSDNPVTASKGEGATGRALADLGVSREQRRNQEFVTNTLGNDPSTGKPYVAKSAAANLALKAKLSQQAGDKQGSDDLTEESKSLNSTIRKVLKG